MSQIPQTVECPWCGKKNLIGLELPPFGPHTTVESSIQTCGERSTTGCGKSFIVQGKLGVISLITRKVV